MLSKYVAPALKAVAFQFGGFLTHTRARKNDKIKCSKLRCVTIKRHFVNRSDLQACFPAPSYCLFSSCHASLLLASLHVAHRNITRRSAHHDCFLLLCFSTFLRRVSEKKKKKQIREFLPPQSSFIPPTVAKRRVRIASRLKM